MRPTDAESAVWIAPDLSVPLGDDLPLGGEPSVVTRSFTRYPAAAPAAEQVPASDDAAPTLEWDADAAAQSLDVAPDGGEPAPDEEAPDEEHTARFGPRGVRLRPTGRVPSPMRASSSDTALFGRPSAAGPRRASAPGVDEPERWDMPASEIPSGPPGGPAVEGDDEDAELGMHRAPALAAGTDRSNELVAAMLVHPAFARALHALCDRFRVSLDGQAAVIDLVTLVAQADGAIDAAEMALLRGVVTVLLGEALHPSLAQRLIHASVAEARAAGVAARAAAVGQALRERDAVEDGVFVALAVGYASHGLVRAELGVVEQIALAAGLAPARIEVLRHRVGAAIDPDWSIPPPRAR